VSPSRPAFIVDAHLKWEISDELFAKYRDLIYREAGIALTDSKKSLLVSRVAGRLRELGLTTFDEYFRHVEDPAATEERGRLLDRICTNETHFFRDPRQFLFLNDHVFPRLEAEAAHTGKKRVRAWSAACSTGEEPYSLAMALLHRFPTSAGWQVEVVATDLSNKVLAAARAALWPIDKAEDIPPHYRKQFMLRGTGSQTGKMKAGPEIRNVVSFNRMNLNESIYSVSGVFDFIFCRNVLIYFDRESKAKVVERLMTHLAPEGCLFLGYAETTTTITDRLVSIGPNVYARIPDGNGAQAVAV
jgi:chemotaxis protein methyltransferase CheR